MVVAPNPPPPPPQVWDLIVVGAGIAGAAFAYEQGLQGRRTLLLERDLTQPDRIVGELLQPGGYLALKRLGLERCVEGIDAQKVKGYYLFKNGVEAPLGYPLEGMGDDVAGRSFHHGRFIQKLREAAAAAPNVTVRQGTVKQLINDSGNAWEEGQVVTGVKYKASSDGQEVSALAHLTIVCDGMYSTFRKKLSKPDIEHPSFFVALLLKNTQLPHPFHGHVILAKPSPVLFYPISSTEARCLVDYPGSKLPSVSTGDMQRYLLENIAPQVPPSLREPFELAVKSGRIRSLQNSQIYSAPLHQPGALLLGDAFNMRHPLTGGGMTVAFSDTALLCDMLRPLPDLSNPIATSEATAKFYVQRKPVAATINTLANALYAVFNSTGEDVAHEEMQQACFDYLKLGGMYSNGPVSLLSGLNPRPSVLVAHFFMVAFYGVGRLLLPRPSVKGLWVAVMLIYYACTIILPIIKAEGIRAVFMPFLTRPPVPGAQMRKAASQLKLKTLVASSKEE